jgi:hypothetical protein
MLSSLVTSRAIGCRVALESRMLAMAFSADEMSRDAKRMQQSGNRCAIDCAMQKPMPLFAPVIRMILDMVRGGRFVRDVGDEIARVWFEVWLSRGIDVSGACSFY